MSVKCLPPSGIHFFILYFIYFIFFLSKHRLWVSTDIVLNKNTENSSFFQLKVFIFTVLAIAIKIFQCHEYCTLRDMLNVK